jgi:uncharacterized protein
MEPLLAMVSLQAMLGAFDVLYHHELTERLTWRKSQWKELLLHGVRNIIYTLVFIAFGFVAWHGFWAWLLAALLLAELFITLWDFIEEDGTRKLPPSERITHTLLALNYGVILALFYPVWQDWQTAPSGFYLHSHGLWSWLMACGAIGVFLWGLRDGLRGLRLMRCRHKTSTLDLPALKKPNQRILVTGGTGFLGTPLCRHLIAGGHQLTIITRDKTRASVLFDGGVRLIAKISELQQEDIFDIIINLAGEPVSQRWTKANMHRMRDSRLQMTSELVEWCTTKTQKPRCMIQASAIGIYGTSETATFIEDSPRSMEKTGLFPRELCEDWEEVAKEFTALGIRTCRLRIGVVLGIDGGALSQMLIPFDLGIGGRMGNGRQWLSWVHKEDVLRAILHCIDHEGCNGAYNITAPQPVTNTDFSAALGKAMRRPAFLPLPAFQINLLFGAMGKALLLSGQRVLPKRLQESGFQFRHPQADGALENIFDPWRP